jgi:Fungal specific transcription factor domain
VAIEDEDLMNLLLAYSACHRAMLLEHEPPANRIARWVENVFPKLFNALSNPESLSLNIVATSVIFASLEIISPTALEVPTTWRQYLSSTRGMLESRAKYQPQRYYDDRNFFICRWFGYLDIIGSLSGPRSNAPTSFDIYWVEDPNEMPGVIDCFFGCTMQCMRMLGQVASLVKEAQDYRLDNKSNRVRYAWSPSADTKARAETLLSQLMESVSQQVYTCPHDVLSPGSAESRSHDLRELETTNILYHWAGIIQLRRRVLNYAQDSFEMKDAVNTVLTNLDKVRAGSPAEACLLFPIFTAGCEALDGEQRARFKSRIADIEGFGLKQVR